MLVILEQTRQKVLTGQDNLIVKRNKRLRTAKETLDKAARRHLEAQTQAYYSGSNSRFIEAARKSAIAEGKALEAYKKAVEASEEIVRTGTGKVGLLLPSTSAVVMNQ